MQEFSTFIADLVALRDWLVGESVTQVVMDATGVKLESVVTDVTGKSTRAMIEALIAGERDPEVCAEMTLTRMRPKIPELRKALLGRFDAHHVLLARMHLDHVDSLTKMVVHLGEEVDEALRTALCGQGHHHRGAHTVVIIIWRVLDEGATYDELGASCFDRRNDTSARQCYLVRELERLGHHVTLDPAALPTRSSSSAHVGAFGLERDSAPHPRLVRPSARGDCASFVSGMVQRPRPLPRSSRLAARTARNAVEHTPPAAPGVPAPTRPHGEAGGARLRCRSGLVGDRARKASRREKCLQRRLVVWAQPRGSSRSCPGRPSIVAIEEGRCACGHARRPSSQSPYLVRLADARTAPAALTSLTPRIDDGSMATVEPHDW